MPLPHSGLLPSPHAGDGVNLGGDRAGLCRQDPSGAAQWDGHQRSRIPAPHGNSLP